MPLKGYKAPLEVRRKLAKIVTGRKHSLETRKKIQDANKGEKCYLYGKHLSEETRKKISDANKKKRLTKEQKKRLSEVNKGNKGCLGYHHPLEYLKNLSNSRKGEKNPRWRGGISSVNQQVHNSDQYVQWRTRVYLRDDFTCQECGQRGGNIEAHHKKPFSVLMQEVRDCMPLFDLYTACMLYTPMWDVSNGKTLCKSCHGKIKKSN